MNLLKQARKAKKMSQGQLSQKTGLSRQYLSRIERGEVQHPNVFTAHKICKALGRTTEEIWIFD